MELIDRELWDSLTPDQQYTIYRFDLIDAKYELVKGLTGMRRTALMLLGELKPISDHEKSICLKLRDIFPDLDQVDVQ